MDVDQLEDGSWRQAEAEERSGDAGENADGVSKEVNFILRPYLRLNNWDGISFRA